MQEIWRALADRGGEEYGGEAVTQLQHGLQCAMLAEREGASETLIVAALLHDIGHMIDVPEGETIHSLATKGIDALHEDLAVIFLSEWFGPEVTAPIRHHVAAKRYLCFAEPDYFERLSPASRRSLQLQGGVFSRAEAEEWIARPYAREGVMLRRWDDLAKDPAAETPPISHFRAIVERVAALS